MPKIKTSISTASDEFKANAAAMRALVADLAAEARWRPRPAGPRS